MRANLNTYVGRAVTLIVVCAVSWYGHQQYKASKAREEARERERLEEQQRKDEEARQRAAEYAAKQAEERHRREMELERLKIEAHERDRKLQEEAAERARLADLDRKRQEEEARAAEEEQRRIQEENRQKLAEAAMREGEAKRLAEINSTLEKYRDAVRKFNQAEDDRYQAYKEYVANRNRLEGAKKDAGIQGNKEYGYRRMQRDGMHYTIIPDVYEANLSVDVRDLIAKAKSKRLLSEAEISRCEAGLKKAAADMSEAKRRGVAAQKEVEFYRDSLKRLDALHLLASNLRDSITTKIYMLKDGKTIRALTAMETEDKVSLKTESGEIVSVDKSQIESVTEENSKFPDASIQVPGLNQAPKPKLPTYILKDGKEIRAIKVVDGDDVWSIKDENGKYVVVKKSDVERIENQEASK